MSHKVREANTAIQEILSGPDSPVPSDNANEDINQRRVAVNYDRTGINC